MNSLRLRTYLSLLFVCGSQFVGLAQTDSTDSSALKYQSDFSAIKQVGNDLFEALKPSFKAQLNPNPIWYKEDVPPLVRPFLFENEKTPLHIVFVSKGFVQLVNSVAHAKAIDKIEPGFFEKYIQKLSQASGEQLVPALPEMSDPKYWTDDVINEQLSYFNQIVGAVAAINLAHQYLGQADKYGDVLHDSAINPVTMATSCTPGEWEQALKLGAGNALDCGFGMDGLKAFYECIVGMEKRPGWTFYFLPAKVRADNLPKIKKMLDGIESRFFGQ